MGESVTLSINCPILIGRAGHLATLQQFIEQAKHGTRNVALISGEAGIGKSRLVAEAKTYAALEGFFCLARKLLSHRYYLSLCTLARPLADPLRFTTDSYTSR